MAFLLRIICKSGMQVNLLILNQGKKKEIPCMMYKILRIYVCRSEEVHSQLPPSTSVSTSSMSNTGHRFLQPRVNSGSSVRRMFPPGTSPTSVTTSNSASASGASFAYQSVSIGMESSGVALPVQRIIEGLPVVTLPGIVAHEVRYFLFRIK